MTLVSAAVSSVCFVFVKINASKNEDIKTLLIFGIGGAIGFTISFIVLCVCCRTLRNGLDWMNCVQHIIPLNGELWHKQINSLQNTIPPKEVRVLCQNFNYDRFKKNPFGYIVLAEEGIIIDEIFIIRYDIYVINRIDIIENTATVEYILRLLLITRINSLDDGIDKGKQIAFEVYLFMPASISIQQVTTIREQILSNSHKQLEATKYFKHVRNKR